MVVYRATPERRRVGRAGRRRRVSRLPGDRARRSRASRSPIRRCASRSSRCCYDQDLNTPMRVFARDEAGNTARADFDSPRVPQAVQEEPHRARRQVPRPRRARPSSKARPRSSRTATRWRSSWSSTASCGGRTPRRSPRWPSRPRRRCCGAAWSSIRSPTAPSRRRSPISAPTSTRARRSTSRCTSASTSPRSPARPIVAANRGKVLFAEELGIYGNCVIIDHGMGVQSLYGHLSSIDVKAGDMVEKEQTARPQRHDRPGRRRSPALHDAGERQDGEPGRVVGSALDPGPHPAQAAHAWSLIGVL